MNRSESVTKVCKAIAKIQAEHIVINKDGNNPHFKAKYATLKAIVDEVLPLMNKNGLVLFQTPTMVDGVVEVETTIMHSESGEYVSCNPAAVCDGSPQKVGSAITYLKRYGLSSILGIVTDEDDDGNKAQGKNGMKPKNEPNRTEPAQPEHSEKDVEMRVKLMSMLLAMADNEPGIAEDLLADYSTFQKKSDGKTVKGKRDPKDLSPAWLKSTYGKVKTAHAEWFGKQQDAEPDEPDDGEIPF